MILSPVPSRIVALSAGLRVSRGGTAGSTDKAVFEQLSGYPRALFMAAALMGLLAVVPGLPFVPFIALGGVMAFGAWLVPRQIEAENRLRREDEEKEVVQNKEAEKDSVKTAIKTDEIELALGKQVSTRLPGARS